MRTWETPVTQDLTLKVKAKKDDAERVARAVRKLHCISAYRKEITGVWGEYKDESVLWVSSGYNPPRTPEKFKKDMEAFISGLPPVITDIAGVINTADEIFGKYVHVKELRRKRAEVDAEKKKYQEARDAREKEEAERTAAFVSKWCLPEKVAIPEDRMAVYLQLTYDGSDPISDYYAPHMTIGEKMLLGIASPQPRTEKLARGFMELHPELKKQKWSWHVENYSMGHGNYLVSDWTGDTEKLPNGDVVRTRFEVRIGAAIEMYPYKNYKHLGSAPAVMADPIAKMSLNAQRNGVELKFTAKPDAETLAMLRSNGFRWHMPRKIWYAKQSPKTIEFAQALSGESKTAGKAA